MTYLKNWLSKNCSAQPPHNPAQPPLEHQGSCWCRETSLHNPPGGDWAHTGAKMFTRIWSQIESTLSVCICFCMPLVARSHLKRPDFLSNWTNAFMQANKCVTGHRISWFHATYCVCRCWHCHGRCYLKSFVKVCMTHSNTIKTYDCSWDGA